jgi:hypothetical protein
MPLPRWVEPQLSRLVEQAPTGPQWVHEIKFDGFRMVGRIERGKVQLLSKSLVPVAMPDINVRAVGKKNTNVQYDGRNGVGPIPKDCEITFEIADPNKLRPGTWVDWMVRNEGIEAEMVNELGHRAGNGFRARRDSAYTGTHYMDCILRQNGRIYGVRRVPVRSLPPRNPAKRLAWRSLQARR